MSSRSTCIPSGTRQSSAAAPRPPSGTALINNEVEPVADAVSPEKIGGRAGGLLFRELDQEFDRPTAALEVVEIVKGSVSLLGAQKAKLAIFAIGVLSN